MCGNMGGGSGGGSGKSSTNYNSNGDYIKKIDTEQLVPDVGTLPALQGSEKQIQWAESIRNEVFDKIDKAVLDEPNRYNSMIDQRTAAIERGEDISSWGKITEDNYKNAKAKAEQLAPAADLAKKSYAEFFKEQTNAGNIIDMRRILPGGESMVKAFSDRMEKQKASGKTLTVEDGVQYIKRKLARGGYKL